MISSRGAVLTGILVLAAHTASAQSWRVRIDARAQAVTYRGLTSDSISSSRVEVGEGGGFETPEGYAVQCSSPAWCYFYRPGPLHQQVPMNLGVNAVLWGFGVRGLTLHLTARLTGDAGDRHPGSVEGEEAVLGVGGGEAAQQVVDDVLVERLNCFTRNLAIRRHARILSNEGGATNPRRIALSGSAPADNLRWCPNHEEHEDHKDLLESSWSS